jgi:hypothetical protein
MAIYTVNGSGASNVAATYDTTTNTPTINAATNLTVSSTARFTATFTAPNIVNKCTGVWIFMGSVATAGNSWTATLQESTVDKVSATVSDTVLVSSNNWVYFRFATPYTFTTTGAGAYRFKLTAPATSGNARTDTGGTLYAFIATDDRHTLPGVGDDVYLAADNSSGTKTLTLTGTANSWGSGSDVTGTTNASIGLGLWIGYGGIVTGDTTANHTLQIRGYIIPGHNGTWQRGTSGTPMPNTTLSKVIFDQNGVTGNYGFRINNGQAIVNEYTAYRDTYKFTYSSGLGTTVSPLTIATTTLAVNDELVISSSVDYTQIEYKFIKTIVDATHVTLSDTKGGVEAGLVNTHAVTDDIFKLESNIIWTSTVASTMNYFVNNSQITTAANFSFHGTRFEYSGMVTSGKQGVYLANATGTAGQADYCVLYKPGYSGLVFSASKVTGTVTNNIAAGLNTASTSTSAGFLLTSSANNKTFTNCYAIGLNRAGFNSAVAAVTFNNCKAIGCNQINAATLGGWYFTTGCTVNALVDCEIHCNRVSGINSQGMTGMTFTRLISGSKGTNTTDLTVLADAYHTATFDNSLFGSATLISGYTGMIPGSEVRYHKLNQTTNNHAWYSYTGSARSTGAALTDTTVRTPNSLGVVLKPEDVTDGFTWSFNIPSKAMSITNFFGWFELNAAFTGDAAASARVELWLPGSSAADASYTLLKTTNAYQSAVLSATNTSSTDGLAEVRVIGLSTTASAYIYADDFYNAGDTLTSSDKVTGLDTWYQGKPVSIIQPSATSAADIWNFPTSGLTTAGTTGYLLTKLLTVGKFLGLK